jgi:CheY-like chemotaxis protein
VCEPQTPANADHLVKQDVELSFAVSDSGIGIPRERLSKLFQPFTQADGSTTRNYGGSGLGLVICKRLVRMMKGDIHVQSKVGRGSVFSFTARFGRVETETKQDLHVPQSMQGRRVLVVDDNEAARLVLSEMLKQFSFDVSCVESGKAALAELEAAAATQAYSLVLLDWKMSEMEGVEVARRIRNELRLPAQPGLIMLTAYGREDVRKEAEKAGIDAFLNKPVTPSSLLDRIMETFDITHPGPSSSTDRLSVDTKSSQAISGARVLLVEDNTINQQVAQELLETVGLHVDIADNGKVAVERLLTYGMDRYDAVLMDVQMPEMDGYEATRKIRQMEDEMRAGDSVSPVRVPIIGMTAHALDGEREKCLDAGMDDYVSKPIEPERLFEVLQLWISGDRKRQEFLTQGRNQQKKSGEMPVRFQEISGFDTQAALARLGGNIELYKKLLHKFSRTHVANLDALRKALKHGNRKQAEELAHTLAGVSGNLGANALQQAASDLETALKTESSEILEHLFETLASDFELVVHAIQRLEAEELGPWPELAEPGPSSSASRR